jgi:hypothetical protein
MNSTLVLTARDQVGTSFIGERAAKYPLVVVYSREICYTPTRLCARIRIRVQAWAMGGVKLNPKECSKQFFENYIEGDRYT